MKSAAKQILERPGLNRFGRSKRSNRQLLLLPAIVFVILILSFVNTGCKDKNAGLQMIIKAPHSNTIHYRIPVQAMDEFTLSYRHSVSLSIVEGTFLITAKGMILPLTTTFSTYGPGLPVDYKEDYSIKNGIITIYNDEEPRESIRLWVSPQTEEKILYGNREYSLANLAGDHLLLEIFVE